MCGLWRIINGGNIKDIRIILLITQNVNTINDKQYYVEVSPSPHPSSKSKCIAGRGQYITNEI